MIYNLFTISYKPRSAICQNNFFLYCTKYEKFSKEFGANTRLAKRNLIRIDKIITSDLGLKNFTHLAAEQWNRLPQEIRSISKQEIFKKEVKNWIRNNVPIDP